MDLDKDMGPLVPSIEVPSADVPMTAAPTKRRRLLTRGGGIKKVVQEAPQTQPDGDVEMGSAAAAAAVTHSESTPHAETSSGHAGGDGMEVDTGSHTDDTKYIVSHSKTPTTHHPPYEGKVDTSLMTCMLQSKRTPCVIFANNYGDAQALAQENLKQYGETLGNEGKLHVLRRGMGGAMVAHFFEKGLSSLQVQPGGQLCSNDHVASKDFDSSSPRIYAVTNYALPRHMVSDPSFPCDTILAFGNSREHAIAHADSLIGGALGGMTYRQQRYSVAEIPQTWGVWDTAHC